LRLHVSAARWIEASFSASFRDGALAPDPESRDSGFDADASPRNDEEGAMVVFTPWGSKKRQSVSADFDHALTQGILRTELIRTKALIGTAAFLAALLCIIYFVAPETVSRVWMGHLKPAYLYSVLVPFILFELWVHAVISRHLKLHYDVPKFRRYLGALIETSMPTAALAL